MQIKCISLAMFFLLAFACKAPEKIITLQKTACYGACPVYTLDIYANREVNLSAERFVGVGEGEFHLKLSQAAYSQITRQFANSNFFSFNDRYRANVSDLPTIFLTFSNGDERKTIELYGSGPEALHQLAGSLQHLVDSSDWKPKKTK